MIIVKLASGITIYQGQSQKMAIKVAKLYADCVNYSPKITKITKIGKSELLHYTQQQPTWYHIVQ